MSKRMIAAIFVGSLGGFVFGYDLGALSAATPSLRSQFALSPGLFGLTVSASLWGTVCGSLLAGRLADTIGRRRLITACSLLYALSAICIALPVRSGWALVLAMRVLCGVAVGGLTVGCPLYLSEIAPIASRGRVVGLFQLQVGVGVVVAFSVGAASAHLAQVITRWKWDFGLGALPAIALALLGFFLLGDGTPRSVDHRDEGPIAAKPPSLHHYRSEDGRLFRRKNTRSILLATSIALFNQLSGVNILLLYMLQILASAGIGFTIGHTYTIVISCLSLAITALGMTFVDRLGRKPLLFAGSAGMAVCLSLLAFAIPRHFPPMLYLSVLVAYNAFFAFSQGTVVWVYLSELFPPGVRGVGQGYGTSVHWIANAILVSVFPSVQHATDVGIFYILGGVMLLQIAVVWLWYPETRGTDLGACVAPIAVEENRLH